MIDILITACVSTVFGAAMIVVMLKISRPKKKKPKELCVDEVLKAADDALAFDPLAEAKNRPEAVKPLLAVLLAIREKKAAEDLAREEEHRKGLGRRLSFGSLGYGYGVPAAAASLYLQNEKNKALLKKAQSDVLSGVVDENHPHWIYTAAGREAAARAAVQAAQQDIQAQMSIQKQLSAYVDSPSYDGGVR